jgi:hypothetical protein
MTAGTDPERMDRVADRLADALADALTSLDRLQRTRPLTDDEAVAALSVLLHGRGMQLNDDLLRSFVAQIG